MSSEYKKCKVVKEATTHEKQLSQTIVSYKGEKIPLSEFKGMNGFASISVDRSL